jgi:hypothetical protein
MDSLVKKLNAAAVHEALESLPKEVDDIYDEALERIEQQNEGEKHLAKQILSWITHARRPLHVYELQHALAVVCGTTSIDPDNLTDEDVLTSVCAGLVVIDEEGTIIRLVRGCLIVRFTVLCLFQQITQLSNILNESEILCFRMLKSA